MIAATHIDFAPRSWDFSTALRDNYGYFQRFLVNAAVILAADVAGLLLSFQFAAVCRWQLLGKPMYPEWIGWFVVFWTIGTILWGLLPGWGLPQVESLRRQVLLLCFTFGIMTILLFLSRSSANFSRFTILLALLAAIPTVPFLRLLAKQWLVSRKIWGIPVAVYGGGTAGRLLIQRLQEEKGHGYHPACVFDDDPELQNQQILGVPVVGRTDSIARGVPVAILAMTKIESSRISELMHGPLSSYLRVVMIPNLIHAHSLWATSRDLSGIPGLELCNNLLDPSKQLLKRCLEVALILATLPLWGPICACVAALIWVEDGRHPLFKQKRIGLGGKKFDVWKFRTMVPNAEAVLLETLKHDVALRNEWKQHSKLRNDPRITRIGKILRKTSLDEIPQLINVLCGEMSLVGPRPLPAYHHEQLPADVRKLREKVKPGITGLWQVSGRSDAGTEGMALWDPYYVRNWSIWLDIVIVVRTIRVVLQGSGAR